MSGLGQNSVLLAYYGDDFTGSTDVMEALTTNGVEAALSGAVSRTAVPLA